MKSADERRQTRVWLHVQIVVRVLLSTTASLAIAASIFSTTWIVPTFMLRLHKVTYCTANSPGIRDAESVLIAPILIGAGLCAFALVLWSFVPSAWAPLVMVCLMSVLGVFVGLFWVWVGQSLAQGTVPGTVALPPDCAGPFGPAADQASAMLLLLPPLLAAIVFKLGALHGRLLAGLASFTVLGIGVALAVSWILAVLDRL